MNLRITQYVPTTLRAGFHLNCSCIHATFMSKGFLASTANRGELLACPQLHTPNMCLQYTFQPTTVKAGDSFLRIFKEYSAIEVKTVTCLPHYYQSRVVSVLVREPRFELFPPMRKKMWWSKGGSTLGIAKWLYLKHKPGNLEYNHHHQSRVSPLFFISFSFFYLLSHMVQQ